MKGASGLSGPITLVAVMFVRDWDVSEVHISAPSDS
jgi:hypothetical protein